MRRDAHDLRETLGLALVLAERLAREHGNLRMVKIDEGEDDTGEARFQVAVDDPAIADLELK